MHGSTLLGLFVTGWLAQAVPPASTPVPAQDKSARAGSRLRIATSAYLSDGGVVGAPARDWPVTLNQSLTVYATSGRTQCDARPAAIETPSDASYGWRVTITPVRDTTAGLEVRVTWQQMWAAGRPLTDGRNGGANLTLHPGNRIIVDYLNAGSGLTAPLAEYFKLRAGPSPTARDARDGYQQLRHVILERPDAGCHAVGMGLEIGLEPVKSAAVVEAELWLVRPNRDGTERSERQIVRLPLGQPPAPYAFDEQTLMTPLPASVAAAVPTAKVSGELSAVSVEDGRIHLNFTVSRRYEVGPAFQDRPGNERATNATYRDLVAAPGEVVAFQLPTIEMPVIQTDLLRDAASTPKIVTLTLPQLSVRLRAQIVR